MTDIEQARLIKLILMSGIVLWMIGAPLYRAFASKPSQSDSVTPTGSADDVSESDRQAARAIVREAAYSFAVHWGEQHSVEPDLLEEFAEVMSGMGVVEALTLDASLLKVKGHSITEVHKILLKANHYLFMTWRKYPFSQDRPLVIDLEKECLDAGLLTIKKIAPLVRQNPSKASDARPAEGPTVQRSAALNKLDKFAADIGRKIESSAALRQVLSEEREVSVDAITKLIKIDELRDQGILSDNEFDAKKKLILQAD